MKSLHPIASVYFYFHDVLFNLILICMSAFKSERVLVQYVGCVGDFRQIIVS